MVKTDPYTPERGYFECLECGHRTAGETRVAECPKCGGEVQNLAVARE